MTSEHTVRSYDAELGKLRALAMQMGELAVAQLALVVEALGDTGIELPTRVIEQEPQADRLEQEIEQLVLRILALRQPTAIDLREVLTALRLANEIERICDHAENVAQRLITLHGHPVPGIPLPIAIGKFAATMLRDVVDAFKGHDLAKARQVWGRDATLDEMYSSLVRELLTHMMEDPRRISAATHLLFIARDLERVGDRATNMAEMVEFMVAGEPAPANRRKADVTPSLVIAPPARDAAGPRPASQ